MLLAYEGHRHFLILKLTILRCKLLANYPRGTDLYSADIFNFLFGGLYICPTYLAECGDPTIQISL